MGIAAVDLAISARFVQAALMILIPLSLWVWWIRRRVLGRHGWAVVGFGCLFFIVAQFVETPFRLLAVLLPFGAPQIVALSLVAGVGEEGARYVVMRFIRQVREGLDRRVAVSYGLGHGGFESLAIGLGVLASTFAIRNAADPAALAALSPGLVDQAESVLRTPWYVFIGGAVERVFAIALHVGLSLIVYRAVVERSWRLLLVAMLLHTAANATAIGLHQALGNILLTEAWVAIAAAAVLAYGAMARDSSERVLDGASRETVAGEASEGDAGRS